MAIELPLSHFWIIKFLFSESDFNAVNSSELEFKGATFSLKWLDDVYSCIQNASPKINMDCQ